MKRIISSVLLLSLLLLASQHLSSESLRYYVTEEQLQAIEQEMETQQQQLEVLRTQLRDKENLLQKSESNKFRQMCEVAGVSVSVGLCAGIVIGVINGNQK